MLVTFKSPASGDVPMMDSTATQLLKMMGASGNVPGALLKEEVPDALERLNRAVEAQKRDAEAGPSAPVAEDEDGEQPVTIAQRAYPLIELLKAAAERDCEVIWEGR